MNRVVIALLIGIVVLGSFTLPFVLSTYSIQLLTMIILYAVAASGLDLMHGYAGMLSLGHAAFFGIGAYTTTLIARATSFPMIVAVAFAVLVSGAAGMLVGWVGLRMRGVYFPLITLAATFMFFSFVDGVGFTGGTSGLSGVSRNLFGNGELTEGALFITALIILCIVIVGLRCLKNSRTGRALELTRTHEGTAEACGINAYWLKLQTIVTGAGIGGGAGGLFVTVLRFISPDFVGLQQSIDFLIMVVVGGLGTGWGVIAGSLLVEGLPEFAQGVRDWQILLLGVIMLVVVTRFRRGVAGSIEAVIRRQSQTSVPKPSLDRVSLQSSTTSDKNAPEIHEGRANQKSSMSTRQPLLSIASVGRKFEGHTALDSVTFDVFGGEIHALVGPNGAGKTTMINCITGLDHGCTGEIRWKSESIRSLKPHSRARLGMSRTFQLVSLAPELTILQNVMLGNYMSTKTGFLGGMVPLVGRSEDRMVRETALNVLSRLGIDEVAEKYPSEVAIGQQRLAEVGRCLVTDSELLLLDEPAAGLNGTETNTLGRHLRAIASDGVSILLVEHDMGLVMNISDRISVLNFGNHMMTGNPEHVMHDPAVVEAYLGRTESSARSCDSQ